MMALLSMMFVACDEDFSTEFVPQTTMPESSFPASAVTVTPSVTSINLVDLMAAETEQPIVIGTISLSAELPQNTILKAEVEISDDASFSKSTTIEANSLADSKEISVMPSALSDAYFNNITKNPAATTLYVRALLYTVTDGSSVAIIGKPGENYFASQSVAFTPEFRVFIEKAYYYVGATNGWSDSDKTYKFDNGGGDVYENPVFTVTVPAPYNEEGTERVDNWFKIAPESAYTSGDFWNNLVGARNNGDTATEGELVGPGNVGAFNQPASDGATMYRISINMLDQTYSITPIKFKVESAYYYVGAINGWSESDKTYVFSNGGKDPLENPVYTCVVPAPYNEEGTERVDNWFKIAPESAYASGDFWNNLFGVVNNGATSTSGELAFGNVGAFCQPASDGAKFYRISINPKEMTYEITPLNFQQYIYEAGVNNGWGGTEQPLYCADGNGTYTGFFYAKEDSWTDGKGAFKFRGAADNWDNGNYGTGTLNADGLTGTLVDDSNSGNIMPQPGFYRADVNLADMTYTLTPINSVYVVGSAVNNDWDNGVQMTYNHEKLCWECDANFTEAGVIKFKGNGTWDTADGNWGGTADNIINGSNDNIPVTVSGDVHIEFYPLCETKAYCTITKK